jgi:hypothetical protein
VSEYFEHGSEQASSVKGGQFRDRATYGLLLMSHYFINVVT